MMFARGTGEPPGVGVTGQAFVDSLRAQTGGESVGVYAVSYPATADFANSIAAGVNDSSVHVQSTAANCPNTKMVLGGFSQGAAVVDNITETMPPAVADQVAAVAVFGNPKSAYAAFLVGGPLPAISTLYAPQDNRPVCTRRCDLFRGPQSVCPRHVRVHRDDQSGAAFAAGRL
jgi:cutinase